MQVASVVGKQSGFAAAVMAWLSGAAATPRKLVAVILLAALLAGALGVAIYKRADIADLVGRASKVLGQSASAAGNLPLAKTLVALLDQRSPGERTKGELANDKQRSAAQQRALGKVRPALPAPFVQALTTPIPALVPEVVPIAGLNSPLIPSVLPGPVLGSTPGVFVGGGGGPGGGGGGPGGGGGGPGGGGGGPGPGPGPGIEVPPVVVAVPEPASWLTLILGFFILARALRSQRLAKAHGAALTA